MSMTVSSSLPERQEPPLPPGPGPLALRVTLLVTLRVTGSLSSPHGRQPRAPGHAWSSTAAACVTHRSSRTPPVDSPLRGRPGPCRPACDFASPSLHRPDGLCRVTVALVTVTVARRHGGRLGLRPLGF
jgi:hypothetical protein